MKVKDLMEELATYDQNSEVILQKDAEGNDYSPLEGSDDDCVYVPRTTWAGQVYSLDSTFEENDMEEEEWEPIKKQQRCVVLFPVN
jgi:C1A family cysteine protease